MTRRDWPLVLLILFAWVVVGLVLWWNRWGISTPEPAPATPIVIVVTLPPASPTLTPFVFVTPTREPLVEVTATTRTPATATPALSEANGSTVTPVPPTETPRPVTPTAMLQRG